MATAPLPNVSIPETPGSFNLPQPKKIIPGAQEKLEKSGVKRLLPGAGKAIDPNAQAKLAARGTKRVQPEPPEPGFEGLEEVTMAAEPGFEGLQEVDPGFEGLQEADKLDYDTSENLARDDSFRPAEYIAQHPEVTKDAAKFQKLLDTYRQKRVTGLETGKVLKTAVKEAPGILAKTVKGAVQLGERALDIGFQPLANSLIAQALNLSPEELEGVQAETGKQQLKAAGEVTAGTEQAVTGIAQLAQQGGRKLFGKAPKDMTDDELYDQLLVDAEFHKATQDISQGKGDVSKAAGLDADFLQKNGVELDQDAIANLSLVDPVTLVATAGVFKVVGVGGKILATAATRAGAEAVVNGLKTAAAKSIQLAGRGATAAGQAVQKLPLRTPSIAAAGAQIASGDVLGAIGAAAAPAAVKLGGRALAATGRAVTEVGEALQPGMAGPRSAGLTRISQLAAGPAGQIAGGAAKGAVAGTVAAAPLAAAAQDSETAGALLGGGAILGATAGAGIAGKNAIANVVAKRYLDPHTIPFEAVDSPGYGIDGNLDRTHDAAINALPESDRNAINNFREAIRQQGGEIYVQDPQSFLERVRESMMSEQGGNPLTPEQEAQAKLYADSHAFFDGYLTDAAGQERRAIFLNNSAKGLPHDAGHLFQAMLSPEHQARLRQAALDAYSPQQLKQFGDAYAKRLGEPDYFNKLGEEAGKNKIADELIAENFSQLFSNAKFADLKAPQGFLSELGGLAAEAAEALGIDLKAGRTTPDLQAQPSFRLQNILRNAAREVLNLPEAQPRAPFLKQGELTLAEGEVVPPKATELPTAGAPKPVTPAEVLPETPVSPRGETAPPSETATRATERGVDVARKLTEGQPEAAQTVETIAASMEAGNPVLRIEHRGITQEPGAPRETGRTPRRGTQEKGYQELEALQIENRKEAPPEIVSVHEKTFVPVRFVEQGGKATLVAMSMDKVLANIRRVVSDATAKNAADLIPYENENGKLTEAGWNQALADLTVYAENQSNGYRGDGQKLVRPSDELGASIPAENPNYTPQPLGESQTNFANLIQGLAPPKTARAPKGQVPGNVKAQEIAELQGRVPEKPATVRPEDIEKQRFAKPFESRTIAETNPLRNQLAERGVNTRALTEVTERLAAEDIASVEPSAGPQMKAPVTDVIRGGFLPKDQPVSTTIAQVLQATPEEWQRFFGPKATLTQTAFELGLGLKDASDLRALQTAHSESAAKSTATMQRIKAEQNFDLLDQASAEATKAQFFREAVEAATDTGSASGPSGWRRAFPDQQAPFSQAGEQRSFLARTQAGREAAEKGFDIEVTGNRGARGVVIRQKGVVVGEIRAKVTDGKAFIESSSIKKPARGQGLGEAGYRELLTQLKEDGVTEVSGEVVAPQPLAIRRKIFGEESTKVRDDRGEVPIDQALSELNDGALGFQVSNEIRPDMSFLPGEGQRDFDVVWQPRRGGKVTFRQKVSASSPEEAQSKIVPKSGHVVSVEETLQPPAVTAPSDLIPLTAENESLVRERKFLPKPGTPEYDAYVEGRIEESKKFPEAIPLDANKDPKTGRYKSEYKDEPNWIRQPYDFSNSPLAEANRGKDVIESENKYTDALSEKLQEAYREAKKNPAVEAGETWYSTAREKIQTLLGEDAQLFAELLGATSPQTGVDVNFGYAVEAYNLFKQGYYDKILEKYREGRTKYEAGEIEDFTKETGKTGKQATEKAFLTWWADKHKLEARSNRQKPDGEFIKFGMHTPHVLRVFDRSWLRGVEGPKTPNFAGNLSGGTFEATIDKWAARLVRRLSHEGLTDKPWRILPPAETGVSDPNFFTAQKAFRKAGDALGVSPDALQAILWFFEKNHWEEKGWDVSATGTAKSDYNVLLKRTEKSPEGQLKFTKPEKPPKEKAPKKPKKSKGVSPEDLTTEKQVDTGVSPDDIE